jgi:8-oxo-dGTP pyrophosphatase MutT (NUDIX family)
MSHDLNNLPYDDLFDTYLADGRPHPDSPHHYSTIHREGLWHKAALFFGVGYEPDPVIYLQKRSEHVAFPGKLAPTASGHVDLGDTPLQTKKEIEEEVGLVIPDDNLIKVNEYQFALKQDGLINNSFHYLYLFEMPSNPWDKIQLNSVEVSGLYTMKANRLEGIINGEAPPQSIAEGWKITDSGSDSPALIHDRVSVTRQDLLPDEDQNEIWQDLFSAIRRMAK